MRPNINYGSRSKYEGKAWRCSCGVDNLPTRKLVFSIPKFECKCGKSYFDDHDLDFCLADVRVNGELLVQKIFEQSGPECMANACCLDMQIMHAIDCLLKDKETDPAVMAMNPEVLVDRYKKKYPGMQKRGATSVHKFIKMALNLRDGGVKLKNGTYHKIGDVSFIRRNDYGTICEEVADGNALLVVFTPGINYVHLKYGEAYRPPFLEDFHECNNLHKLQKEKNPGSEPKIHEAHMVVLLGPAFKGLLRDFYFADSHGYWLPRHVFEDLHDSIPRAVNYGIGKIEGEGIVYNVVKFWQVNETATPLDMRLEEEDDEAFKFQVKPANRERFCGPTPLKRLNPVSLDLDPRPLKRLSLYPVAKN